MEGESLPVFNPQHPTSHSLPNKITRSFWLPHLAAILAFTAETWLSLSASTWKSSWKKRNSIVTHARPGYQCYTSAEIGWALKELNSTSKENSSWLKYTHQQILNTTMGAECDVSVEKNEYSFTYHPYLQIFPFFLPSLHRTFSNLLFSAPEKITTHHPVLRINAGRHPPVTCSFISGWFQDFHRHCRCHWFCGAVAITMKCEIPKWLK